MKLRLLYTRKSRLSIAIFPPRRCCCCRADRKEQKTGSCHMVTIVRHAGIPFCLHTKMPDDAMAKTSKDAVGYQYCTKPFAPEKNYIYKDPERLCSGILISSRNSCSGRNERKRKEYERQSHNRDCRFLIPGWLLSDYIFVMLCLLFKTHLDCVDFIIPA